MRKSKLKWTDLGRCLNGCACATKPFLSHVECHMRTAKRHEITRQQQLLQNNSANFTVLNYAEQPLMSSNIS